MEFVHFSHPTAELLGAAALLFVLRLTGVAISTVRTLVMMRGRKLFAVVLSFLEVLVWVLALGPIANHPPDVWMILAYCLGYCSGTWCGMLLDDKAVLGHAVVRAVSRGDGKVVLDAVHAAGFGATLESGSGREGHVSIVTAVVRRREVLAVCDVVHDADPASFVTVEEARTVMRGYLRGAPSIRR